MTSLTNEEITDLFINEFSEKNETLKQQLAAARAENGRLRGAMREIRSIQPGPPSTFRDVFHAAWLECRRLAEAALAAHAASTPGEEVRGG